MPSGRSSVFAVFAVAQGKTGEVALKKNRIALLLPWTGKLPFYWSVWQNSAADRCFDIVVVRKTLEAFAQLVQETLFKEPFRLVGGYKLCDLRPMFGVLFANELRNYDYWAFGDCDVMYGRQLDVWIEKVVAGDYEVATVQRDFTAGPFTLIKNCEKCNRLFEKASGWHEILMRPKTMAFDELGEDWFRKRVSGHRSYEQLRCEQESFSAVCWREQDAGRLRFLSEKVICEETLKRGKKAEYRPDGALLVSGREVPLYHFMSTKMRFGFTGDERSLWVSRGWPFMRDVLRFAAQWLAGKPAARRRVAEWWQRRRGNPNWWQVPAWNNLDN